MNDPTDLDYGTKINSNRDLLEQSASKLDFLNSCDNETCVAEVDCEYD